MRGGGGSGGGGSGGANLIKVTPRGHMMQEVHFFFHIFTIHFKLHTITPYNHIPGNLICFEKQFCIFYFPFGLHIEVNGKICLERGWRKTILILLNPMMLYMYKKL